MSRLIKGSSIKLSEKSPPPTHCTLHAPQRGGKGGGRLLASPDISPHASASHAPATHATSACRCPTFKGRTHARSSDSKMGLQRFNPPQPVKPPTLTSICQQHCWSSRGGDGLFGWLVGWLRGGGAIPCSIPTNFLISFGSNALSQIHAPNLSSVQPLPPPSCFFSVILAPAVTGSVTPAVEAAAVAC